MHNNTENIFKTEKQVLPEKTKLFLENTYFYIQKKKQKQTDESIIIDCLDKLMDYQELIEKIFSIPQKFLLGDKKNNVSSIQSKDQHKIQIVVLKRLMKLKYRNKKEHNLKKVFNIVKKYLSSKKGIRKIFQHFFKKFPMHFNQANLRKIFQMEPLKQMILDFLNDNEKFKEFSMQYMKEEEELFLQNYTINFNKFVHSGQISQFQKSQVPLEFLNDLRCKNLIY